MKKIRPLGNRILVRRATAVTTKGGILLPEAAQEKPKEGEVVSVGPGSVNNDGVKQVPSVKAGDRVLFTSYAGTKVKSEEEDLLIMSEDDILAVLS